MAIATHIQRGNSIDYIATADIAYREIVPLASRIGIALEPIAKGESGTLAITEVWELPAAASLEIAVGDKVYWNTENGNITKTNTDVPAGTAVEAKTASAITVRVKID